MVSEYKTCLVISHFLLWFDKVPLKLRFADTHIAVEADENKDSNLKEVFRPMLPHVSMEVRSTILKYFCKSHKKKGNTCRHDGHVQSVG